MKIFNSLLVISGITLAAMALLFHIFALGAGIGFVVILWLFRYEIFDWCCGSYFALHEALFGHDDEPL